MAWRDMTEQEAATRPEARLGGALLWVVLAAAVVCVVAIVGALLAFDQLRQIGIRYMIAVGFAGDLVGRLRRHDLAAPAGDAGGGQRGLPRLDRLALRRGAVGQAGWPLAVDLWAEAVLAAGFCGYMAGGVRPNAYYRRRLPAA